MIKHNLKLEWLVHPKENCTDDSQSTQGGVQTNTRWNRGLTSSKHEKLHKSAHFLIR